MAVSGIKVCRRMATLALALVGLGCLHQAMESGEAPPPHVRQRAPAAEQEPLRIAGSPAAPPPLIQTSQTVAAAPPDSNPAPPPLNPGTIQLPPAVPVKEVPTGATAAGPELAPASPSADLNRLYAAAAERAGQMDSYWARLRRKEFIKGKDQPEEVISFQFRREPFSVHMKWLSKEQEPREIIYVKGKYEGKLHIVPARSDLPFPLPNPVLTFAPDDPKVREGSRHSIAEAGLASLVDNFGNALKANERGDRTRGTLTYLGTQRRPEYGAAVEAVEQAIPASVDPLLPRGGKRSWYFDPRERLPMLVITQDERGHEVEYYCYDLLQFPVKLDDEDFDPSKLGKSKK